MLTDEEKKEYCTIDELRVRIAADSLGKMMSQYGYITGMGPLEVLVALETICYGLRYTTNVAVGELAAPALAECDAMREKICQEQDAAFVAGGAA